MTFLKKQLLPLIFSFSLLAGCGSQQPQLAGPPAPQVGSFARSRTAPASPVRSDEVLDQIYKRLRVVHFNGYDKNHDGMLDHNEFASLFAPVPLSNLDKDQDGRISLKEYVEADSHQNPWLVSRENLRDQARYNWNYMDTNKDNFLSLDETIFSLTAFSCSSNTSSDYCYQTKVQATTYFNLSDKNLDRKLNFSEWEDMASQLDLASVETPLPAR